MPETGFVCAGFGHERLIFVVCQSVLGGPWFGLIAAVAVTFFIGLVLAPLVAWALTGWRA